MEESGYPHGPVLRKEPQYPLERRLVGPQVSLEFVVERKIWPCRELIPGHPAHCIVTILTAIAASYEHI
jgi:hypothetical protein